MKMDEITVTKTIYQICKWFDVSTPIIKTGDDHDEFCGEYLALTREIILYRDCSFADGIHEAIHHIAHELDDSRAYSETAHGSLFQQIRRKVRSLGYNVS